MTLDYTSEALADLNAIWDWNSSQYDKEHADTYVKFLLMESESLRTNFSRGRPVPAASKLQYRVIKKRKKGHGHVVVYEVIGDDVVRVLRYFHTAQDWPTNLSGQRG